MRSAGLNLVPERRSRERRNCTAHGLHPQVGGCTEIGRRNKCDAGRFLTHGDFFNCSANFRAWRRAEIRRRPLIAARRRQARPQPIVRSQEPSARRRFGLAVETISRRSSVSYSARVAKHHSQRKKRVSRGSRRLSASPHARSKWCGARRPSSKQGGSQTKQSCCLRLGQR